jgi:hypothetical protein
MLPLQLLTLFYTIWFSKCEDSTFIGWDGHEHQRPVSIEREKLRRFIGRRHARQHTVTYQAVPVHHGLHTLNHHVVHHGPGQLDGSPKVLGHPVHTEPFGKVKKEVIAPFGEAVPVAAHAIQNPKSHWNEIRLFRAEMCVKMLEKHGEKFTGNKDKCIDFMDKRCKVKTGTGICEEWYVLLGKVGSEDLQQVEAEYGYTIAMGPTPAMAMSPAPAPAFRGEYLPSQGFGGDLVAHSDGVTQTDDWHAEYGPHHREFHDMRKICKEYPNNKWCKAKGYHDEPASKPKKKDDKESGFYEKLKNFFWIILGVSVLIIVVVVARGGAR